MTSAQRIRKTTKIIEADVVASQHDTIRIQITKKQALEILRQAGDLAMLLDTEYDTILLTSA